MQGLGGGAVPATSHSVSAPTRWIRKHGPGLATSTASRCPMTALAIARMHCLPRLSYSDRLSMLGFYLRAGVVSVSPSFSQQWQVHLNQRTLCWTNLPALATRQSFSFTEPFSFHAAATTALASKGLPAASNNRDT
jgi:hypothetical protein